MGVIFESDIVKRDARSTATHVLLVGCEEYPNLAAAGFGLAPLSSPRRSVEAIANWFLSGPDAVTSAPGLPPEAAFFNPEAPLGSLEIVASPIHDYTAPSGAVRPVTRSSLENVRQAYKRWIARLGDNRASRGIFYFCGHGVGDGADQFLITDEFGEDSQDPWRSVFHVSNTCQVSIRSTAANLLFLIDACTEFSPDVLQQINTPQALVGGSKKGSALCTNWWILRASTTNRVAYADSNGVARFTTALLNALRGHCGQQRASPNILFDVTAPKLGEAAAAFLSRFQSPDDQRWQKLAAPLGEGDWNIAFHVLTTRPSVLVELDVDPTGFRPVAQGFIERNGSPRRAKTMTNGPVSFVVPWGEWTYGVSGGNFREQSYRERLLAQAVVAHSFQVP